MFGMRLNVFGSAAHTVEFTPEGPAPVRPDINDQLAATNKVASENTSLGLRPVTSKSCQS